MTLIEIENIFIEFSNQLQALKDKYPNTQLSYQINHLMTDTQIIKLKLMRMESVNEQEKQHLNAAVGRHIAALQQQVQALKSAFVIVTFDA